MVSTEERAMFNTDFCFTPGKLTTLLDGQAGSSGKGKLSSFVCSHAGNLQFACTTASPQAGHWVKLDDGRSFFYQTLNSCAYQHERFEKLYVGPGATIELPALWRELEENGVPHHKLGISPLTSILQDIDAGYERGTHDFNGTAYDGHHAVVGGPLAATGSTAHGCGANRARRVLRRKEARYAKDVSELREFLCDVPTEIMDRLDRGQSGLLEIAQGFQLSYLLQNMYPNCTSRNCTVAAGLDDLMVAPYYAGPVILNFRTFPIRINSNKYIDKQSGRHLTMSEVAERIVANNKADMALLDKHGMAGAAAFLEAASEKHLDVRGITLVRGNSGPGYHDQTEISWDKVTKLSGASQPIMETTSVTKLPRRVFTFSRQNMHDAIRHNRTGHQTFLSVNFANYVDDAISGARGVVTNIDAAPITKKVSAWAYENISPYLNSLVFIGTGPRTDDKIVIG